MLLFVDVVFYCGITLTYSYNLFTRSMDSAGQSNTSSAYTQYLSQMLNMAANHDDSVWITSLTLMWNYCHLC